MVKKRTENLSKRGEDNLDSRRTHRYQTPQRLLNRRRRLTINTKLPLARLRGGKKRNRIEFEPDAGEEGGLFVGFEGRGVEGYDGCEAGAALGEGEDLDLWMRREEVKEEGSVVETQETRWKGKEEESDAPYDSSSRCTPLQASTHTPVPRRSSSPSHGVHARSRPFPYHR
jgi:hypothetical protein